MLFYRNKIIIRLQGGLGNQLYCYATARALSIKTGKKLYIDTRPIKGEGPNRQYDLSVFNIKEQHVKGITRWIIRWVASVRLGKLFKIAFPLAWGYRIYRDKEEGFDSTIFKSYRGSIILQGYWQSFKYFETIGEVLKNEFTIKLAPDDLNKRTIEEIDTSESVALHVRRGDYVHNSAANSIHGTCTVEYYQKAIDYILRQIKNPVFYIFTDDPDWAKVNIQIPAPSIIVKNNLGKNDYEDLRLMTHCKHFIIANSSFSWWGAWLANNPNKIVVAPQKWFQIDRTPGQDRIPNNWIRI